MLAALALLICRRARQQKRLQLASVLPAASAISNAELWKLTLRPKLLRLAQRKAHDEGPEWPRGAAKPVLFVESQRPGGLLRAKTTRLQLGNYLCVASK